jgi:hypothetical protein
MVVGYTPLFGSGTLPAIEKKKNSFCFLFKAPQPILKDRANPKWFTEQDGAEAS